MKRIQYDTLLKDVTKKIVLLVGPRQAGKTWLAKSLSANFEHPLYLSYDRAADRAVILHESWLESTDFLILDEIHKMPDWKNYLKGVFDTRPEHLKILVTGSARLDVIRYAGDSLAGRFYLHHLLPFSPSELRQIGETVEIDKLITRGGFPEAYLSDNDVDASRWRQQYIHSLLTGDAPEFTEIQNIHALRLIFNLLRERVGSPISYQAISEDVAISPNTVKRYIEILESLYIVFRVTPFSTNIARSLKKEPKIYFFDTALVKGDVGANFENFVALCLLKHAYAKNDLLAENYHLHYIKTKEGLEVDFVLAKDDNIEMLIEVKYASEKIPKNLIYFQEKYGLPAVLLVKELKQEYETAAGGIVVRRAEKFLSELFL